MSPLYRYALKLTRDKYKAEDLLQDTYERMISKKDTYITNRSLLAWALCIMHNIHINNYRLNHLSIEYVGLSPFMVNLADSFTCKLEVQEKKLKIRQIKAYLKSKGKNYLSVALLRGWGLKYREIANIIQVPRNTIKTILWQLRQEFKHQEIL